MANASKILRRSVNAFLTNYHFVALVSAVLVLPFAVALLVSQTFSPSSSRILRTLSYRLHALFDAAGLPASSQFFSLLNLKLSQTIFSFLTTLPFTLTFLLLAKAVTIRRVLRRSQPASSSLRLYRCLVPTYVFNSFVVLSANAAVVSVLFLAFNALEVLHVSSSNSILVLSAAGAVLYSIVLANTTVICSLAMIMSAVQNCSGYLPLLKTCLLVRGREATAIATTLPTNLGMAAVEALFQYRVARPYLRSHVISVSVASDALLIALLYSLVVVLDTIVTCMLYRSCDKNLELEPNEKGDLQA